MIKSLVGVAIAIKSKGCRRRFWFLCCVLDFASDLQRGERGEEKRGS